ncbi:hypothetical protein R6Z07F_007371 [Ovis aries]|uniref:Uncharacterized protein n=1 Tax=Ovis aries TaxID=9940 RepID=A0A836D247_SHEEP|nr:hypothetical protein JEQ12_017139 [Ovis aries]
MLCDDPDGRDGRRKETPEGAGECAPRAHPLPVRQKLAQQLPWWLRGNEPAAWDHVDNFWLFKISIRLFILAAPGLLCGARAPQLQCLVVARGTSLPDRGWSLGRCIGSAES